MITVIIAEPNNSVRLGLRVLLEADLDIQILKEAGLASETVSFVEAFKPAVLILEWRMPDAYPSEFLPKISASSQETKILIVSTWTEKDFDIPIGEAKFVSGYVSKKEPEHLVTGVKRVAGGKTYKSPSLKRLRHV